MDTVGDEADKFDEGKPKLSLLSPHMIVNLLPVGTNPHVINVVQSISYMAHAKDRIEMMGLLKRCVTNIRSNVLGSEHAIKFCCMGLEYGAKKYHKNNWKTGFTWSRLIDAALRHIVLGVAQGEDIDAESGNPHWGHALCMLMFLQHGIDCHADKNDIF